MNNANPILEVLTLSEIAELAGKERTTIQRMVKKHLQEGIDYRNSKGTILVNKSAISKLYDIGGTNE